MGRLILRRPRPWKQSFVSAITGLFPLRPARLGRETQPSTASTLGLPSETEKGLTALTRCQRAEEEEESEAPHCEHLSSEVPPPAMREQSADGRFYTPALWGGDAATARAPRWIGDRRRSRPSKALWSLRKLSGEKGEESATVPSPSLEIFTMCACAFVSSFRFPHPSPSADTDSSKPSERGRGERI